MAALLRETGPAWKVVQSVDTVHMQVPSSSLNNAKYIK